jgi:hypothetical protein
MTDDDEELRPPFYPPADISPAEFEAWVAELFGAIAEIENLRVTSHAVMEGIDGTYDLDAMVRYTLAGMEFLILVEAKRHNYPIKRELVASLHSKVQSTGAQKGVILATAPFQSGAVTFANVHGIALIQVTEGRHTFIARSADPPPVMSRQEAAKRYGLPTFVGFAVEGADAGATQFTLVSTEMSCTSRLSSWRIRVTDPVREIDTAATLPCPRLTGWLMRT